MLWDTAGQEEYDSITKAYYRGAQACLLIFSTTDRESFLAVEEWKKKVGHVMVMWWSCDGHVMVMWWSCDGHVMVM